MRVDFYQLGTAPIEHVIASLGEKVVVKGDRLLVVASDDAQLSRLDRLLWNQSPASFLPHGLEGGSEDSRQPVLLSRGVDSANRANNILVVDGKWRDSALSFHRVFFLFDSDSLQEARTAWRSLAGRDEVERHFWTNEDGRWTEKASDSPSR